MNDKLKEFSNDFRFVIWLVLFSFIVSLLFGQQITVYLLLLVLISMLLLNADKVGRLLA